MSDVPCVEEKTWNVLPPELLAARLHPKSEEYDNTRRGSKHWPVFFDKYWISANGQLAGRDRLLVHLEADALIPGLSGRILEYLEVRGLDAA